MKTANHIPFQRERRAGHALRSFRGALSTPRGRQLAQNAVLLAVAVLALLALTLTEQFRAPQEDAVAGGADAAPLSFSPVLLPQPAWDSSKTADSPNARIDVTLFFM